MKKWATRALGAHGLTKFATAQGVEQGRISFSEKYVKQSQAKEISGFREQ